MIRGHGLIAAAAVVLAACHRELPRGLEVEPLVLATMDAGVAARPSPRPNPPAVQRIAAAPIADDDAPAPVAERPCDHVVSHVIALAEKQMPDSDRIELRRQLPKLDLCGGGELPRPFASCILAATRLEDLQPCLNQDFTARAE